MSDVLTRLAEMADEIDALRDKLEKVSAESDRYRATLAVVRSLNGGYCDAGDGCSGCMIEAACESALESEEP